MDPKERKSFYQPQSSYQPNIDVGLLAHVREVVFKREEEQRKQKELYEARKAEEQKRTQLAHQINSSITTLPMYVEDLPRCQKIRTIENVCAIKSI